MLIKEGITYGDFTLYVIPFIYERDPQNVFVLVMDEYCIVVYS